MFSGGLCVIIPFVSGIYASASLKPTRPGPITP